MAAIANEIVLGVNGFTEQPVRRVYKPGEPIRTIRTFEGPQALSDAKQDEILNSLPVLNLSNQKGVPCVIEVETDEDPTGQDQDIRVLAEVTWSCDWERDMKDIRGHGYFNESGVSTKYMELIDLAIKKGTASNTDWNTLSGLSHMNDYRECRLKGINSFIAWAPTLRATLVMGRFTKLKTDGIIAGQVIEWSAIKLPQPAAEAKTPQSGGITQPQIYDYVGGGGGWQPKNINQWLVCPVKRGYTRTPRRYELTYEWLGATEWTKALYDGGTGSPP